VYIYITGVHLYHVAQAYQILHPSSLFKHPALEMAEAWLGAEPVMMTQEEALYENNFHGSLLLTNAKY